MIDPNESQCLRQHFRFRDLQCEVAVLLPEELVDFDCAFDDFHRRRRYPHHQGLQEPRL